MRSTAILAASVALAIVACTEAPTRPAPSTGGGSSPPTVPAARTFVVLQAMSDSSLFGTPGGAVSDAPRLRVTDGNGKPVSGVRVAFAVVFGHGSLSDTLVASDKDGIANVGSWILGPTPFVLNLVTVTIVDTSQYFAAAPIHFAAFAVLPDPVGVRYDLKLRDGMSLRPGERGWMVLGNNGKFHIVSLWGAGESSYAAINDGDYTQSGQQLTFYEAGFCCDGRASATLAGNTLTFSYDDYYDDGFHSLVVEVYERSSPP